MATERAKLKTGIKKLKKDLLSTATSIATSDSVSIAEVGRLWGILDALVTAQRDLNATYQALDERTLLERVAKRRKNASV